MGPGQVGGSKTSGWDQKRAGGCTERVGGVQKERLGQKQVDWVQNEGVGSKVSSREGGITGSDNNQCTDLKDLVATDVSGPPGPPITPPATHAIP
jgi:hypothetical protein